MTGRLTPGELAAQHDDIVWNSNRFSVPDKEWPNEPPAWGVGVFVTHEERVLLVREGQQWLLPGGTLKPGESHAEGAARETREETGIAVKVAGLAAVSVQTLVRESDGASREFHFATYDAVPVDDLVPDDDPGLEGEAIEAAAWHATLPKATFDRELVASLRSRGPARPKTEE